MRIPFSPLILMLCLCAVLAQQSAADQGGLPQASEAAAEPPLSWIEIPVRFSLSDLRARLEASVPRVHGDPDHWRHYRGVDVKYRIWRGPLSLRMYGEQLHTYVPIGYWVQARKVLLKKLKLKGSCGIDEPPRHAWLHLVSRFKWNPNWHLDAFTRVAPTHYVNPCQMSIARIDVTPLLDRHLYTGLSKAAREQIDAEAPRLTHLEPLASRAWSALQQPLSIDADGWLLVNPQAIRVAPFRGDGERVHSSVGIGVRPVIVYGPRPVSAPTELPPLRSVQNIRSGFSVRIDIELPFNQAAARLVEKLEGAFSKADNGDRFGVAEMRITGEDERIRVDLVFEGAFEERVRIVARPRLDRDLDAIVLQELEYLSASPPPLWGLLARPLEKLARWPLAEHLETVVRRLDKALNRTLGERLSLRTDIDAVVPIALRHDAEKLTVTVQVSGSTRLSLNGT